MGEIQSIKIPNFSVSQCDSLSGLCVQRENPSLSNVSSACMRSFTFHIVAGKKYSGWQASEARHSQLHFKNKISQLKVRAHPVISNSEHKLVHPKKQILLCSFPLLYHLNVLMPVVLLSFSTLNPNWLNSQLQSESSKDNKAARTSERPMTHLHRGAAKVFGPRDYSSCWAPLF